MLNEAMLAATLSLKFTAMVESTLILFAPFAGVVLVMAGAASTGVAVVNEKLKFAAIASGGSIASVSVT